MFYILSILLIGLNGKDILRTHGRRQYPLRLRCLVPWNYPNLSNKSTTTSPFTIVFKEIGSTAAASYMNAVILTSVLSAGNHALFAGTRVLYGLASIRPVAQAPRIFSWTTKNGVPLPALAATSSVSILCFGSSFIGSGQLWSWLQNIVGVSNQVKDTTWSLVFMLTRLRPQIAWVSIGLASLRFRRAWIRQGRSLSELKYRAAWTWPWGPYFVIITTSALIISKSLFL